MMTLCNTIDARSKMRNSVIGRNKKRYGENCSVKMNYFPIHFKKDLYAYKVSFIPLVSESETRIKILEEILPNEGQFVYDGFFTMYSVSRGLGSFKEFSHERDEDELKIVLEFDCLVGNDLQILHVLDLVLRTILSKKYIPSGRYFYKRDENGADLIGQGLECRQGFYQKLFLAEKGHFSLNIDVAFAPFYQSLKVDQFVVQYLNIRDTSSPLSPSDWAKVKLFLSGVKVMHNDVEYKILDIPYSPTDRLFEEEGTTDWSYIVVGYAGSQPIYFPMEVCQIVSGQQCFKKLNEKQEASLSQRYTKRTQEREKAVTEWIEEIKNSKDEHTKEFGLKLNSKLISINDARQLPAPKLIYHDIFDQEVKVDPSTGKWSLHEMKFFNGGTLRNWAAINFSPIDSDSLYRFIHDLRELCILKGMVFQRVDQNLTCASIEDIEGSLERLYTECGEERLQILFVILPDMSGCYGQIKTFLETRLGVVSQCILSENVKKCGEAKFSAQFFENLAQKINAKIGGSNTCLADAPSFPMIADRGTIILGGYIDHCKDEPSISAVVACMDPSFLKYRCTSSSQTQGEQIDDMVNMVREHISFYREIHEELYPKRVIYYRAVGSEGIQSDVLTAEVEAIKEAFSALEAGIPQITLVLAERRHNTSLYPDDFGEHWMGNVLPGTVVDTKQCQPDEFFLCSHGGVQGTSRPTHYRVMHNTNNFTIDTLEAFTYVLCFTSVKCTRSISTVPPVYYARLAAARTRVYLKYASTATGGGSLLSAHPNIRDGMYFV